jgi:hypothetical protein
MINGGSHPLSYVLYPRRFDVYVALNSKKIDGHPFNYFFELLHATKIRKLESYLSQPTKERPASPPQRPRRAALKAAIVDYAYW